MSYLKGTRNQKRAELNKRRAEQGVCRHCLEPIEKGYWCYHHYLNTRVNDLTQRSKRDKTICGTRAKLYGILEILLARTRCVYCGVLFDPYGGRTSKTANIDRVIPSLGYVPDNLQIICQRCNVQKSAFDITQPFYQVVLEQQQIVLEEYS